MKRIGAFDLVACATIAAISLLLIMVGTGCSASGRVNTDRPALSAARTYELGSRGPGAGPMSLCRGVLTGLMVLGSAASPLSDPGDVQAPAVPAPPHQGLDQ